MGCFENLIIVFGSVFCNILCGIVERFSLIRKYRYGWLNHVEISCTFVWFVLSMFFD